MNGSLDLLQKESGYGIGVGWAPEMALPGKRGDCASARSGHAFAAGAPLAKGQHFSVAFKFRRGGASAAGRASDGLPLRIQTINVIGDVWPSETEVPRASDHFECLPKTRRPE